MANTVDLVRKLETRAGFIARRLALDLEAELRAAAAPHRKTGQMEGTIKVHDTRISPTHWLITATAPTIQAVTTNYGARPHVIRARNKKALAFTGRSGDMVIVRSVNHPGNKGDGWFTKVMSAARIRVLLGRVTGV